MSFTDNDGNLVINCVYCSEPLIKIDKPFNLKFYTGFSICCSNCHAGHFRNVKFKNPSKEMLSEYLVQSKQSNKNDGMDGRS